MIKNFTSAKTGFFHQFHASLKKNNRQEILMDRWGFDCHCSLCEEERINSNDEKYDHFEKCKREAVELCLSRTG